MSQVIAGIYEIERQIGAGGGGVVYLGHHLRLEKPVVLKADKRRLNAGTEKLRREVDMLKGLSHSYIPQVYDFVQEDGTVYTVMDYIEGESLDKLLGRRQFLTQPQIIKWACQLLEALSYLHSRPPYGILHGDIKPANIMLRPEGDICLIDYNIALALGEDGAVKVGFSRGYASPEHYGADYISENRPAAVGTASGTKSEKRNTDVTLAETDATLADTGVTEVDIGEKVTDRNLTIADSDLTTANKEAGLIKPLTAGAGSLSKTGSTTSEKKGILLDVRSDIYSLGATLYHMLSGHRPAQDARDVVPLGPDVCSPAVSSIIKKAMEPDPVNRYQSAEEMLTAFLSLHINDTRVLRHKRREKVFAAIMTISFLAGGGSAFVGLKQQEQIQAAFAAAEYSANALAEGNVSGAVDLALQAIPSGNSIFEAPVTAQAQKALTDALGVYDLSDGFKAVDVIALPSAPFKTAVSPSGSRFAAVYAYEVAVYDAVTLEKTVSLPIRQSALSDAVFPNENSIVYAGEQGVASFDLDTGKTLWTGEAATALALSGDGEYVAAVNRDEDRAMVYRVSDGEQLYECSFEGQYLHVAANDIFADPDNDIFTLNEDGSLLAVSFSNGGLMICDLDDPAGDLVIYEESQYDWFEGGFCGEYFAYAANSNSKAVFGLIDIKQEISLGESQSGSPYLLQASGKGIYLANNNLLVKFEPETFGQTELAYTDSVNITGFSEDAGYVLVATDDNRFLFYDGGAHLMSAESCQENCDFVNLFDGTAVIGNRNEPDLRVMKLESHSEAQLWSYDPRYIHDEARISQDGKTAMLFSYEGFAIYGTDGQLVKQAELPDAENIYDQQFYKDGNSSRLEVIWYDGTVRRYSAADGSLISETAGQAPDKSLNEEFYTDQYRIVSSLHDAPEVYDLKSDKLAAVLEEDSYLTYVTQVNEYILTEYVSAAGERYGLLLNSDLQILAYLPNLCDVTEEGFVFDDGAGNLRQSRLYSLQELIAIAEGSR